MAVMLFVTFLKPISDVHKESGRVFSVLTVYDLLSITSFSATKKAGGPTCSI